MNLGEVTWLAGNSPMVEIDGYYEQTLIQVNKQQPCRYLYAFICKVKKRKGNLLGLKIMSLR